MSTISEELSTLLENDIPFQKLQVHPNRSGVFFGDLTIPAFLEQYELSRQVLTEAIKDGTFDKIPYKTRIEILENFRTASTNRESAETVINYLDRVNATLFNSSLYWSIINKFNPGPIAQKITDLNKSLKKLTDSNSEISGIQTALNDSVMTAGLRLGELETMSAEATTKSTEIGQALSQMRALLNQGETALADTKIKELEIENKRLSIETFASNIEEYKARILDLEKTANDIVSNEGKINTLIGQAETALNLKSAEGISAAFSSQYAAADLGKGSWLKYAAIFIGGAVLATAWIVTGWHIDHPESLATIIGRVAIVGLMVGAASFCASQYTRQKTIAEDYAYKAVLAKSILAFSNEIKIKSDTQVADYLTKVLAEIHKDPQRSRRTKSGSESKMNPQALLEKVIEKLPGGGG